jgi:hypothetical protein
MLTELYIEALLADEALADEVWALWDRGVITHEVVARARLLISNLPLFLVEIHALK